MGRTSSQKRLRRLEKEINRYQQEHSRYNRKLEELKDKKLNLLNDAAPKTVSAEADSQDNGSVAEELSPPEVQRCSPNLQDNREVCRRALEELQKAVATLDSLMKEKSPNLALVSSPAKPDGEAPTSRSPESNPKSGESGEADTGFLEMLNSPAFREAATGLLGQLLKDQ